MGDAFHEGVAHFMGVAYGGGKPKVSLLAKSLELQYHFVPFSKAAK